MKKSIKSLWAILLTAVMLLSALPVIVLANDTHTLDISFSETADGKTIAALILSEPERLTSVEFSVNLISETSVVESLSTENTDLSDMIFDFESIPENSENTEIFTYTSIAQASSVRFSGFFLESLTSEESVHLCDITFSSDGEFTEDEIFVLSYTLTGEEWTETRSSAYSLKNQDIISKQRSYILGDADFSGKVDASDARLILRTSVGLDTLSLETAPYADSDYDGTISAADARFSLRLSVGLENEVMHSYSISLQDGKYCEEGGIYTFTCRITGKTFSMDIPKGGHICHETADCLTPAKCEVCDEELSLATGHNFDEIGICTDCYTDKELLDEAKNNLINLLDEVNMYDLLADEANSLHKNASSPKILQNIIS